MRRRRCGELRRLEAGLPERLATMAQALDGIVASRPVQAAIDAYGTYARASNLADYVELLALQGETLTLSQLADLIRDQGWTTKMNELFTTVPAPHRQESEEEDGPESIGEDEGVPQARRVFNILEQRGDVLGDLYPFELTTWLSLDSTV